MAHPGSTVNRTPANRTPANRTVADRAARAYWAALAALALGAAAPSAALAQAHTAPQPGPSPSPRAQPSADHSNVEAQSPVAAVRPVQLAQVAAPAPSTPSAAEEEPRVVMEADLVTSDDTARTVTASGNVQIRYKGRTLRADSIVYNLDTGEVTANGHVEVVSDDGSTTFAEQLQADQALNIGVARDLRATLPPTGSLAAHSALHLGEGRNELHEVVYTSCPICEDQGKKPTWTVRARRASQDQQARIISYQGATLEVAGVPILYLPYFAHPDPSAERASGLLTPDIGRSGRTGFFYEQPYHWVISPYSDATVSVRGHQYVNPLLGVEYRKRFYSGEMIVDSTVTQEREFDGTGNKFGNDTTRSSLFAQGRFAINDYWTWGFGAERISDDLYLKRYHLDGYGEVRGPYVGDATRLISQLYATGQDEHSFSQVSLVSFQGLRATDSADLTPTILPYAQLERVYQDPVLKGQLKLDSNIAVLQRSLGADQARASVSATWRRDAVFGPGWVISPFAQARGDFYRVETSTNQFESFSRALGYGGVELSWPFMRVGNGLDVVVEPVVMAAYGSQGGADPRIVNEDSIGFEVDESNLFRPNAVSNYDLWEPGARTAVGVRATAQNRAGQSARVFLGRRWRDEASPQFTVQNNLEGTASDWVGAVEADLGKHLDAQMRFRLDDENLALQRLDAEVRASLGRFSSRTRYYQVNDTLSPGSPTEEVSSAVAVQLGAGWSAQYGVRRDLDLNKNISQDIRAIYQDDCTFLELTYSRSDTLDRRLGPDEGFRIRIGLTSLGMAGSRNKRQ